MILSGLDSLEPIILRGELPSLENDCACPALPRELGSTKLEESLYHQVGGVYTTQLTEDWSLFCNTLAGGPPSVLNHQAVQRWATFEEPRLLTDAVDQELALHDLIAPSTTHYAAPQEPTTMLTAWLHVTNACNLDCPYCYVRKSGAKMSLETGQKAIEAIMHTALLHGFTTIKLKYAGGEATLHYRMVQALHAYALTQAEQHGLQLRAVVLSNGTVIPPAFADWLAATGVRLMLSVDGIGEQHDAQRPWKGRGTGAFAALEHNLLTQLLPRGIRPDVCVTVTGRTAATAREVVAWAIQHDLPFSLNFYRENEQSARYQDLRLEERQIIAGLLDAYAVVEHALPRRPFLDGLLDRVQAQAHSHTCGVGHNYLVITHEGTVAQCQTDLQAAQPFEAATDLIPIVAAGPLHNISVDQKQGCKDCLWRYRCSGGCPIVTLRATGRTDIKSPNCGIYQALLPAALRLEGLRILKAEGVLV